MVALAVDMQQALTVQLHHHREVGVVRVQLNPTLRRQLILHATCTPCKRSQLRKSTRTSMVCKPDHRQSGGAREGGGGGEGGGLT